MGIKNQADLPRQDTGGIATGRHMDNGKFAALVQPLVTSNIAFELALPEGWILRRLTWNGGPAVDAVMSNGYRCQIDLVASGVVL